VEQRIGFCTAPDGVRVAYATTGDGPPLVKASNWLSHIDMDWDTPVWRHWWRELSRDHTFVRYDQRGCGMSDWSVDDFSFDARVSDLEAVVDHLELPRFDLLGVSHGGPIAIEYAVRHPERVRSLVLFGTFARGAFKRGGEAAEERRSMITLMRTGWGRDNPSTRQIFTSRLMPDGTEEAMRSLNDLQRLSTTPENAAAISTATGDMDVVERLPQVTAPTVGVAQPRRCHGALRGGPCGRRDPRRQVRRAGEPEPPAARD
jgi:pimeloyl-ACP methyl ester carboxylesterase